MKSKQALLDKATQNLGHANYLGFCKAARLDSRQITVMEVLLDAYSQVYHNEILEEAYGAFLGDENDIVELERADDIVELERS